MPVFDHRLRNGPQQGLGIGMARRFKHRFDRSAFHNPPEIHDRNAIRDMAHHREIMADEQIRKFQFFLQIGQQVQNLCADGHIERRDRLVTDNQFRLHRNGAGNGDALALATGKFMRIASRMFGLQTNLLQEARNTGGPLIGWHDLMQHQGFGQKIPDRHARIERGEGVLENQLRLAAHGAQVLRIKACEIIALKHDLALIGLNQPQDQTAQGRFAAT